MNEKRRVSTKATLMAVEETLPEAAEHVPPEDVQRYEQDATIMRNWQAVNQALTGKRRRCRLNQSITQTQS